MSLQAVPDPDPKDSKAHLAKIMLNAARSFGPESGIFRALQRQYIAAATAAKRGESSWQPPRAEPAA